MLPWFSWLEREAVNLKVVSSSLPGSASYLPPRVSMLGLAPPIDTQCFRRHRAPLALLSSPFSHHDDLPQIYSCYSQHWSHSYSPFTFISSISFQSQLVCAPQPARHSLRATASSPQPARDSLRGTACEAQSARHNLRGTTCEGTTCEAQPARPSLRGPACEAQPARPSLRGPTCAPQLAHHSLHATACAAQPARHNVETQLACAAQPARLSLRG